MSILSRAAPYYYLHYLREYEATRARLDINFAMVPGEKELMRIRPGEVYELRSLLAGCNGHELCKHIEVTLRTSDNRVFIKGSFYELYKTGFATPNPAFPYVTVYDEVENLYAIAWTPAAPYIARSGVSLSIVVPPGSGTAWFEYAVIMRRLL